MWPGRPLLVIRSREVRVAGSLGPNRSGLVPAPSTRRALSRRRASIACESWRDPRSRVNSSRLRAAKSRVLRVIVCGAFPSLYWWRTEGEGKHSRAFNHVETKPPGRWDIAGRNTAPAPQSEPVTPAPRLVTRRRRRWPLGLGRELRPQGQPPHLPYSYRERCARQPQTCDGRARGLPLRNGLACADSPISVRGAGDE